MEKLGKALEEALSEYRRLAAVEREVDAQVAQAHENWWRTKNPSDAPTTKLHQQWIGARRATEVAWDRVREEQERLLLGGGS